MFHNNVIIMTDAKSYYQSRAAAIEKVTPNLVMIIAGEDGAVNYKGTPVSVAAILSTFVLTQGGFGIPKIEDTLFTLDENITAMARQSLNDPLELTRIRQLGLLQVPISFMFDLKYRRHTESGKGGYLYHLSDNHLRVLEKAGIEYEVMSRR